MYKKFIYFIIPALILFVSSSLVHAELAITNGTFDGGNSGDLDVPDWYDYNTGGTAFWNTASICSDGVNPFDDDACMLGDSWPPAGGGRWIYQAIGVKGSSQNASISIDYAKPTDAGATRVSIKVDVYKGSFPGAADDVDIAEQGLTLIDSVSSELCTDMEIHNFTSSLSLTSASPTDTLWIRISNLPGEGPSDAGSWVVIDNIQLTSTDIASNPNPKDKDTNIFREDVILSWTPGNSAVSHNLFISTDINDVNNTTIENHRNAAVFDGLDVNSCNVGRLEFDKTYYWRVDEVSSSSDEFKGNIWQFTVEPTALKMQKDNITVSAISSFEGYDANSTIDESGLGPDMDLHSNDSEDMWLSSGQDVNNVWIQYDFDKVYKLHQMMVWNYNFKILLYTGFKDVNVEYSKDGLVWKEVNDVAPFEEGTGNNGYHYNTTVDFNDVLAKSVRLTAKTNWSNGLSTTYGLSEVRFTYIPVWARETITPPDEATDVAADGSTILNWRPGRDADKHYLYIGTDVNSVSQNLVDPVILDEASYVPDLTLGQTYFWKIDEVNDNEEMPVWDGPVWSFSAARYLIVDDFEVGYDDSDANAVWATWKDGYEIDENGSQMGYDYPGPYLSTTNHSGGHSAPFMYDNTDQVAYSEATAETSDLVIGSDWSAGHPDTLEVWFLGDVNNPDTDQLYVKLNNANKKVFTGGDLSSTAWTKWEVPLTGINLNNISSITIGVEKTGATGGEGTIFLDDIRLAVSVKASDPGTDSLIAKYDMDNNVNDSSGSGFNGTPNGGPTYQAGKYGMALVFDGNDDYVSLPIGETINTLTSCTISTWVNWAGGNSWQRVFDFGSGQTDTMWYTPRAGYASMRFAIRADNGPESQANASPRLSANNWQHITVVIDGDNSTAKLYLNGDLVATNNNLRYLPKDLGVTTQNWLGRSQYPDPYFNGMLDDFRIYNTALSDGEVKYIYKNGE